MRLLPWGLSLLAAALFPATLFALFQGNWRLFGAAVAVAGLHAVILGAPALAIWRERDDRRLLPVLVGGCLIGALPIGSTMALTGDLDFSSGMLGVGLEVMAMAGAFGMLGALACWLTLYATRQFRRDDEARTLDDLADRG